MLKKKAETNLCFLFVCGNEVEALEGLVEGVAGPADGRGEKVVLHDPTFRFVLWSCRLVTTVALWSRLVVWCAERVPEGHRRAVSGGLLEDVGEVFEAVWSRS